MPYLLHSVGSFDLHNPHRLENPNYPQQLKPCKETLEHSIYNNCPFIMGVHEVGEERGSFSPFSSLLRWLSRQSKSIFAAAAHVNALMKMPGAPVSSNREVDKVSKNKQSLVSVSLTELYICIYTNKLIKLTHD